MTEQPEVIIDSGIYENRRIDGKLYLAPCGNPKGRLVLILSHPGHEDLKAGHLLSGNYKTEVQNALEAAGIPLNDVYVTSMVKCGIGNKPKPSAEQIKEGEAILDYELAQTNPKLIMTLGAEVFKRVMKTKRKQGDSLGEIIDSPYGKLLPNYSPGMILNQDPKKRPMFLDIFEYAARFLEDKLAYDKYEYIVVDDPAVNHYLIEQYIQKEMFSVGYDAEWLGERYSEDEVMYTFQYSCEPNKAIILDISKDGKTENKELLDTMKPLLEHPKADRLGWNIRADNKRLLHRGFNMPEETLGFDGMKACAFFDSRWPKSLETGIKKFTNYEPYYVPIFQEALVKHELKPFELSKLKLLEPEVFYKYCAGDAVAHRTACLNMRDKMQTELPKIQWEYYRDTYLPLSNYFLDLESSGIPIDLDVMEDITQKYTSEYERVFKELAVHTKKLGFDTDKYDAWVNKYQEENPEADKDEVKIKAKEAKVWADFNPASSPQKKALLFDILDLEPAYYTKAGKSPKPRVWYMKQKPNTQSLYSPSTNSKSLSTIKFELTELQTLHPDSTEIKDRYDVVKLLLDLTRVGVFANKFLNKKGTDFIDPEDEEEDEDLETGLKSSYWNALYQDVKIHPDFFECLANFRSSSRPNVQNPASKVLSHIPDIFVPGYSKMSKDLQKQNASKIPRNIRHIFYSGDKDWYWSEVDVAGADLMIAAYLSKDPLYIRDMLMGNFHLTKARQYFRDEKITKDDYSKYVSAKSITFRVAYTSELIHAAIPIQAEIFAESGIMLDLGTLEYALQTWNDYTKYIEFRERCKAQAMECRYIENMRGMRYYFENTDNFAINAGYSNESLAFPIASELALFLWDVSVSIKNKMIQDNVWMKWCKPVNSVHDASYWILHKDLMKDDYFPEVCKYFFTKGCKIATGDNLGMEMTVGDRWKSKEAVFSKETKWDGKEWVWKN